MGKINLERVFDLVVHMRENPGTNYTFDSKKNIVLNQEQQGIVLRKSIQSFMQSSGAVSEGKVIQAFSSSADLPQLTKDMYNVTQEVPEFDTLWQQAYKGVPLKKGQLSWEVADVAEGLTFSLVPEGGKAKIFSVSGNKTTVGIEKYGAGIGVTWEMVEGRKLYQFVDQMNAVRAKLNQLWADIHYGLLGTAAATNTIAYPPGGISLQKDIQTINTGYTAISKATKDKGYGDVANAGMVLYFSPTLKGRVMQALRATNADIIRSGNSNVGKVEFNVVPATTWNAAVPANKAIMVLPGNKIQNSIYMQELGLNERDIMTLSDIKTYWSAFGAIVADGKQTAMLSFS